jgi:hypothetical protein
MATKKKAAKPTKPTPAKKPGPAKLFAQQALAKRRAVRAARAVLLQNHAAAMLLVHEHVKWATLANGALPSAEELKLAYDASLEYFSYTAVQQAQHEKWTPTPPEKDEKKAVLQ